MSVAEAVRSHPHILGPRKSWTRDIQDPLKASVPRATSDFGELVSINDWIGIHDEIPHFMFPLSQVLKGLSEAPNGAAPQCPIAITSSLIQSSLASLPAHMTIQPLSSVS